MTDVPAKKRRQAPGPRGNPVMGNLAEYKRDPITMLLRLQQQYGDVARNRLGPFLTHALAHPQHVQHVLQDNQRNYVRGRFYENFKLFFGDGLLTTDGDFWRRHRRAVQPLFHKKEVFDSTAIVGAAAMGLVERWQHLPQGKAVDVVEEMMHLSMSMLGLMVFNVDISRHAKTVGPAVRFGLQAMMPQGDMNDFIPRWVPTPFNLRIRHARKGIDCIIAQIIEDHRKGHCETSDIISLLLASRHPDTGMPMSEQEVHDEVMTIFLAGHETTGSGLSWALYALAQHPSVLRRLRDELDAKLGGRAPTIDDLSALPYLDQVVNEVLRVYPPIWGFTRDLVDDDEIAGFHIPGGSSVFVSPYVTHRHPEFWSNPDAFDPENFGPQAPDHHKFAFFPFGGGMRKCIGFQTALLQMRVVVAILAQHFDLNALPGHPIVRGALISLRPLDGIRLIIKPRERQTAIASMPLAASDESREERVAGRKTANGAACPFAGSAATEIATAVPVPAAESAIPSSMVASSVAPPVIESRPASLLSNPSAEQVPARRFTWFPSEIDTLPTVPSPALAGKRVAIVNGRPGTAERVAVALARACAKTTVFAPVPGEDVSAAAMAMVKHAGPFDGIVDLSFESHFSLDAAYQWEEPMRRSVALLQACYDDWQAEEQTSRLFYLAVTWMDGRMGYGDGGTRKSPHGHRQPEQPLGGLWAGLAKTLPQELPNCNVRVLDIAPDEAGNIEQRVVAELYRWGLFEVGYHSGRRYTLQARRDELPVAEATPLQPGDVVLFSGGARGIGLLCARAIAERTGATVIVTGREQPAADSEPWMQLDDAGFKLYGKEQLRQATPQRMPALIRKDLARLQKRRELRATLDELSASGLPVHYRVCDFMDAAAVRALCDEFGDSLRMVIHNAGVDQPIRLAQKSADSFIDTVRTKVLGFTHLCAAVAGRPRLLQFCNVGSLTGRWGGMTGETDYAAANEALARLGFWAQRHALACTVKTLVWPTWEGVGMITNFDVTKRYVTPMALDEGVRHWLRELADKRSGEVMFMGAVGRALTPIQIKGFSPIFELPNIAQLITRHHHSGNPLCFQPFARFVTRYRIDPDDAPFLRAFQLDGRAALSIAMLIEHACAVGGWVVPEGFKPLVLAAVVNVAVQLDALILSDGVDVAVELESEAVGYWLGSDWHVDVRCTEVGTQRTLLGLTLVHHEAATTALAPLALWSLAGHTQLMVLPLLQRPSWNSQLLRGADWQVLLDGPAAGARIGRAPAVDAADLWALPHPPELRLPVNHIENVLRAVWGTKTGTDESALTHLRIERIVLSGAAASTAEFMVQHTDGRFTVTDQLGRPLLVLEGVALEGPAAGSIIPRAEQSASPDSSHLSTSMRSDESHAH